MLASGQPTWSNGGKTLTSRSARASSGMTASRSPPSDVAFTFNLVKKNPTLYTTARRW